MNVIILINLYKSQYINLKHIIWDQTNCINKMSKKKNYKATSRTNSILSYGLYRCSLNVRLMGLVNRYDVDLFFCYK